MRIQAYALALALLATTLPAEEASQSAAPSLEAPAKAAAVRVHSLKPGLGAFTERALGQESVEAARKAKADKYYLGSLENKIKLSEASRKAKEESPDAEPKFEEAEPNRFIVAKIGDSFRFGKVISVSPFTQSGSQAYFTVKAKDAKGSFSANIGNFSYGWGYVSPADASLRGLVLDYYRLLTETRNYTLAFTQGKADFNSFAMSEGAFWYNVGQTSSGDASKVLEMEFTPLDK